MMTTRRIACALFTLAAGSLLIAGCGRKAESGTHFGEPFTQVPVVTISQLLETPEAYQRMSVRVKGLIERQCPAAGCWVVLNDGKGHSLKVEMGDYLPKLPQNIGNVAEAEGELVKQGSTYIFVGTRVTFTKKGTP